MHADRPVHHCFVAWDPCWGIALCWLSENSEVVPSAGQPDHLHPVPLGARVKVALTSLQELWPKMGAFHH